MYPHVAHVFIDSGYLRAVGRDNGCAWPNPSALAKKIVANSIVQSWSSDPVSHVNAFLGRTTFYDALPENGTNPDLEEYWRTIETQDDMHLGFGALRGLGMPYDPSEHRHRFAVWAAARATQRGFTTVKNLREAIQATDVRKMLAKPSTYEVSATQSDRLHCRWCSAISAHLAEKRISEAKATYGRAAKLIAVYLKAIVIMGDRCDSSFGHNMHPPIDRILRQRLAASPRITPR